MAVPFDLVPTARLSGIHMTGTVVRRFLISYPVSPDVLLDHLPPGAECATHAGFAWVSACFVRMDNMRPNILPKAVGMGFNYLIHRTRARLPFPDGTLREAVLVLQPNINRRLLSTFGSVLTGVRFQCREIDLAEDDESWRIQMISEGEVLYDATILKASCSETIADGCRFATAQEAEDFLLGVSFGGQWVKGEPNLKLLPETHAPCATVACTCITHKNRFLESLGAHAVDADHAITMTNVPHYFGITPIKTALNSAT
ncbi:DUF2071 domain-containing protein [Fuerstiella marisgermanici]|uniref:Uncharacterized protein n=1 Tax=Fuerstiella marisgermanici TaxID=1891926 RepID=A0A1P8W8U8_9PLAN|nr:DUF2071 domain-containing protein [Fuerstiella marisgermanici]APZ90468.1 hypothetical protein Fuma_00043 [Fuerstiella marisgermanici]